MSQVTQGARAALRSAPKDFGAIMQSVLQMANKAAGRTRSHQLVTVVPREFGCAYAMLKVVSPDTLSFNTVVDAPNPAQGPSNWPAAPTAQDIDTEVQRLVRLLLHAHMIQGVASLR